MVKTVNKAAFYCYAKTINSRKLILILGAGLLLRLYRLGYQSIWYDESVSLYLAQQNLGQLIAHTARDIHPPFYYILLHIWTRVAGSSEFSAGFLSVLFGMLTIAIIYHFASRLYDNRVGTVSALLVALSPFQIWYSQEIRMYTLGAFLGLLAFWGAWHVLETDRRYGALYIIAGTLGLYTLYYFAFLLIAFNIWAGIEFARRRRDAKRIRKDITRWVILQAAILILYSPWLGIVFRQVLDPPVPPWRSPVSLWPAIVQAWSALSFGQSIRPEEFGYMLLLAAAIYLLGIVLTVRRSASLGISLGLYTFGPVALILLISLWTPLFHTRYVFTYSPAFYLILATGLVWLFRRLPVAGVLIAIAWLALTGYSIYAFHYDSRYHSDDFRGAVYEIAQNIREGDAVLINAGYVYPAFIYYYPDEIGWRGRLVDYEPADISTQGIAVLQTGTIDGASSLGWGQPDSDFYSTDEAQTAQALEKTFEKHPRLWALRAYDTVVDPDGFIRSWLEERGRLFEDQVFAGESYIRVQGFLTDKQLVFESPPISRTLNWNFGNGLRLLSYDNISETIQAGADWGIDLYWKAERKLPSDYRTIVELVDENGSPWARSDEQPLGNAYPTSLWQPEEILRHPIKLHIPSGTPPGDYEFVIRVYNPKDQKMLSVTGSQGEPLEEIPALTKVSIY